MVAERSKAAQELMEAFARFKRSHWQNIPGVSLRPREIMVLRWIQKRAGIAACTENAAQAGATAGIRADTTAGIRADTTAATRAGTTAGARTGAHEVGVTISEVSDVFGVTPPTVTQLINGLEESGYVKRAADPDDRRAVRITLTDMGEEVLNKALDAHFAALDGLVNYLGEEDSHTLAELLSRAYTYFSQRR